MISDSMAKRFLKLDAKILSKFGVEVVIFEWVR